jgi:hypothetical protein
VLRHSQVVAINLTLTLMPWADLPTLFSKAYQKVLKWKKSGKIIYSTENFC